MALKRYFHPFGRHSEQLVTPKTTIIDGNPVFTPGLSAEFGNHVCATENLKLQKAIESGSSFKEGTIKLLPEGVEIKGNKPGYSGPATVVAEPTKEPESPEQKTTKK